MLFVVFVIHVVDDTCIMSIYKKRTPHNEWHETIKAITRNVRVDIFVFLYSFHAFNCCSMFLYLYVSKQIIQQQQQ